MLVCALLIVSFVKGSFQNQKLAKLGTLSQQREGGHSFLTPNVPTLISIFLIKHQTVQNGLKQVIT